jgi:hypothetical protein
VDSEKHHTQLILLVLMLPNWKNTPSKFLHAKLLQAQTLQLSLLAKLSNSKELMMPQRIFATS